MPKDPFASALAALAQFQITRFTAGEALQRIADVTVDAIPAADVAGMTMLGDDEQPTTAIYTDDDSPEIDAAQYREGRGPCLDAWRTKRVVRIDQIEEATADYPAFAAACLEHGILSTLSLPMVAGEAAIGAMNLYARVPRGFDADDEDMGLDLAAAAGSVLGNVSAYWSVFDLSTNLGEAMKTRAVIEQAKGMLMAHRPYPSADEAFDVLRRASQRENVKVNAIAQRIVDGKPPTERGTGSDLGAEAGA